MRCIALLAFVALLVQTVSASAFTARDSADCAAFSYANWDYEVQNFEAADRSPEVKDQAAAFRSVALRLGVGKEEVDARIAAMRPEFLMVVNSFIFSQDASAETRFVEISAVCNTIIETAPEMAPFR